MLERLVDAREQGLERTDQRIRERDTTPPLLDPCRDQGGMAACGPKQRLELVYRQRPTLDGPHPGKRLATSKRHEREALDGPTRDSTRGALGLERAVELEPSHQNARALAHLFESLRVQRLAIAELDYSDAWSELRDRGSSNARLPGPRSAENDGRASPTNCSDQPANEARTCKDCHYTILTVPELLQ